MDNEDMYNDVEDHKHLCKSTLYSFNIYRE